MKSQAKHELIARNGQRWTGHIEWSGPSRKPNVPADMVFYRFIIDGVPVFLNNYNTVLKCGRYKAGRNDLYYEVNAQAVRKIKKALESAANSTTKISE